MDENKVFEVVRHTIEGIASGLEGDPMSLNTNLMNDLGFDSLEIVQLCIELEEILNIEIDEREVKFKTLTMGHLVTQIVAQINKQVII